MYEAVLRTHRRGFDTILDCSVGISKIVRLSFGSEHPDPSCPPQSILQSIGLFADRSGDANIAFPDLRI